MIAVAEGIDLASYGDHDTVSETLHKQARMPLYDYLCKKCDHSFELLLLSRELPACPKCGSGRLQKLMSPPAAPGKSAAAIAAARARATREGHTSNYKRSKGKIVD